MMRFFIILFTLFSSAVYCQDITEFNTIYTKTYLETSQKDFNKALKIADSLYTISETPVLQVKSLMLSATLYDQSGEFDKSLKYALDAEKIIEKTDNSIWKAKIYGFLATHYRYVRLFDKSKKYAELGINTVKNITNDDVSNNMMAMMMQEMAYYEVEQKNYKESIARLEKAKHYLANIKGNTDITSITNEQLLGYNYYALGDFDKSFMHYQNALKLSKKFPKNYLVGLIHNGFASIYLKKKELDKAKKHLDIARRIADESKYLALKNEVYNTSELYYSMTKNIDDLIKTQKKHDTVKKTLQKEMETFVNKSYSQIDNENIKIKKTDSIKSIIIGIALLLIIIAIIFFIFYRNKQRKNIEEFKKLLKDLDKKHNELISNESSEPIDKLAAENENYLINEEEITIPAGTVKKILDKLKEFENSKSFTDNSISLPFLASYCETNIKYLSYVINTHKHKDFRNYINELRIDFVVDKLRKFPKYRNYKIAILAEEAGFSSPNKFSTIFKKVTNITPSLFIKYLNETEKK